MRIGRNITAELANETIKGDRSYWVDQGMMVNEMVNTTATTSRRSDGFRRDVIMAAACAAALLVGEGAIVGAHAQSTTQPQAPLSFKTDYFGYSASVSPRVGYTDNINLGRDGTEQDEFIASTVFTANAIYSAPRFTGLMSADVDLSYLTEQADFNVNQRVAGAGTFTVSENLAYFDVSGSTSRQLVGDNARFSQNLNAARDQRTNVHSFSLSPYLNRRFEDKSAAELRYRFSQVFVGDQNNAVLAGLLNDSRAHEVTASYNTGEKLDRLTIGVTAYGARTEEYGSADGLEFDFEQGTLLGEVEYEITPRFSLTGAVGVDEIRSDAPETLIPTEDLSGLFWRSGFRYRPGRKTDIRLEYGRRYDDDFVNGFISYDISRQFRFQARASRDFITRAQAVNSQFGITQRSILDFADQLREGDPRSPEGVIAAANRLNARIDNAQTIGVGASNSAAASLIGLLGRTQFNATVNYNDDEFGFRDIETIGGSLSVERQVSRQLTGYASAFYRFADTEVDFDLCLANPGFFGFDTTEPTFETFASCASFAAVNGETNTVGGRIGARYQLYRNLAVFGEYFHTTRFSEQPLLEYEENLFQAGLTLDF
ncbi:MAG: hypothetical protein AAF224_10115 [Pseudomonadota bacterium]